MNAMQYISNGIRFEITEAESFRAMNKKYRSEETKRFNICYEPRDLPNTLIKIGFCSQEEFAAMSTDEEKDAYLFGRLQEYNDINERLARAHGWKS